MLTLRATIAAAIFFAAFAHAQTPTPTPSASPTPAATPPPKQLEVQWRANLGVAEDKNAATWLVAGEAHVFVSTDGGAVTAYRAADGERAWSWTDPCVIAPVIAGANVAIVTSDSLIALDQSSGRPRWRVPVEGPGAPLFAYGATDRIAVLFPGGIQTWDASGKPGWHAAFTGSPITNVAVAGDLLVFGTDAPALVGLDAATGTARWQISLPARAGRLSATAERVYFGDEDSNLYSYRVNGTPKPEWGPFRRPLAVGPPFADDKTVYFTLLDNSIRGFTEGGGTERSDQVLESRPVTGPFPLGDTLAVALTNGRVVEVAVKTGKLISSAATSEGQNVRTMIASPAPDKSRIYTVTIATDGSRDLVAWAHSTNDGKR